MSGGEIAQIIATLTFPMTVLGVVGFGIVLAWKGGSNV